MPVLPAGDTLGLPEGDGLGLKAASVAAATAAAAAKGDRKPPGPTGCIVPDAEEECLLPLALPALPLAVC